MPAQQKSSALLRLQAGVLAASVLGFAYVLWSYWWSARPNGSSTPLSLSILIFFWGLFIVPPLVVVAYAEAWRRSTRRVRAWCALLVLVNCLLASAHLLVLPRWGWLLRRQGVERFIDRTEPLIAAIKAYEARFARPPARLVDLQEIGYQAPPLVFNDDRELSYTNLTGLRPGDRVHDGNRSWSCTCRRGL